MNAMKKPTGRQATNAGQALAKLRNASLSAERRKEISQAALKVRWEKYRAAKNNHKEG